MTNLRYYTLGALEELRSRVGDHLDWYYDPDDSPPMSVPASAVRESRLPSPGLSGLLSNDGAYAPEDDAENALLVHDALSGLTLHQASIERMWVYLTHNDCPQYVFRRWLGKRPADDNVATGAVLRHFFASGNRGIIRSNGISRLWWLGRIARDVDHDDPGAFLTVLLHRQDVRLNLIERPSVSTNRRVLKGIYEVMREHWDGDRSLFERDVFRSWMMALNRRGGVVLLDALPEESLMGLLHEEAFLALGW